MLKPQLLFAALAMSAAPIALGVSDQVASGATSQPEQNQNSGLCAGGDRKAVEIDPSSRDLKLTILSPELDYLQVSTKIVDGAGKVVSVASSNSFTFVNSKGEILPDGYLEKGTFGELRYTPAYASPVPSGSFCEEIEVLFLVGDGHHFPQTIKSSKCFEQVGSKRNAITISEFSERTTPKVPATDKAGKVRMATVGTAVLRAPDHSKRSAMLVELGSEGAHEDISEENEK